MEKTANRPVQAVIFDLDGLLINTETISYALYQDLLRPYGHTFSVEDYAQNYSGKSELHNMQAIIARFGLPISVAQGTALVSAQEKMYFARGVPLKTGAKELLVYLKQKGYLIALASSSVRARALEALSQHGIASYFDAMVFGAEVARGKPHPDIFCKACDKLHAAPEDCLVLEDSEAGIQSAFSAHIPVICIPDMRQPGTAFQDMAQAVLPILTDVIDSLERRCC